MSRRRLVAGVVLTVGGALVVFAGMRLRGAGGIPRYGFEVVATHPHDPAAYTQGLLFHGGRLYESTGRHGISSVREVAVETGEVLRRTDLPYHLFGEGLARHGDRLYQLTWNAGELRVYDLESFAFLRKHPYEGEGWGLASDGERLVMSDGTDVLRFLDPASGNEVGRLEVRAEGSAVTHLNELEFVDGELYANVWKTDWIARIDPASGEVVGWIDIADLYPYERLPDPEAVPNGIAYDAEGGRLFVTGKLWPVLFEIELVRAR